MDARARWDRCVIAAQGPVVPPGAVLSAAESRASVCRLRDVAEANPLAGVRGLPACEPGLGWAIVEVDLALRDYADWLVLVCELGSQRLR